MRWFRRRRRVDVGTYTDPLPVPQPSIEAQIEDGVLVALAAARLAVTNRLIVGLLRDGKDYDAGWVRDLVTAQILQLAAEKEKDARRVRGLRRVARERPGAAESPDDFRARDAHTLERRAAVSAGLASRLTDMATDPQVVDDIAGRAHGAFLDEFEVSVARGARAFESPVTNQALTAKDRASELKHLADDLERLRRGRGQGVQPAKRDG